MGCSVATAIVVFSARTAVLPRLSLDSLASVPQAITEMIVTENATLELRLTPSATTQASPASFAAAMVAATAQAHASAMLAGDPPLFLADPNNAPSGARRTRMERAEASGGAFRVYAFAMQAL